MDCALVLQVAAQTPGMVNMIQMATSNTHTCMNTATTAESEQGDNWEALTQIIPVSVPVPATLVLATQELVTTTTGLGISLRPY